MKKIEKLIHFLEQYKYLRILIASGKGFIENKAFEKSSTLTFYTLLSLVPLLAISFGIAQSLGFEEKLADQIKEQFASQPEVASKLIEFSYGTIKTTRGGLLASLGVIVLFWTVLNTVSNIAQYFNDIWKVKKPRSLWQRVKSFTPVILLLPIFLVGSSSILVYLSTLASEIISPSLIIFFNFLSYLMSWGMLSFIYIYLPNTYVSWKAGFKAGIVTGIIFLIWQWIYMTFQVEAASYGVIYGSFAAVPLFLVWVNYSWLVILFGAELCNYIQKEQEKY